MITLIASPVYDDVTKDFYNFFYNLAQYHPTTIIILKDPTPEAIRQAITDFQPKLLIFTGHGTPNAVLGKDKEILLSTEGYDPVLKRYTPTLNLDLLKDRIVLIPICWTGEHLIPKIAEVSEASVGFKEPFIYLEPYKEVFFQPIEAMVVSLLNGATVYESCMEFDTVTKQLICEYNNEKEVSWRLYHNLQSLIAYGNKDARVI